MRTPNVKEVQRPIEAVTPDPFVDGLDDAVAAPRDDHRRPRPDVALRAEEPVAGRAPAHRSPPGSAPVRRPAAITAVP